jgi:SNF2 family DNA or RNA helicase
MPVHVELNPATNRIELRCDYYVGVNIDCKKIQGYKFDGDEKIWTYPARMQSCHALRRVFGDKLEIGPILNTWARRNSKLYSTQRSLATKPDSELELVRTSHPLFWEAMSKRPYQRSGAEFISITRHAADFSEPGLGKTATALASLLQAGVWNGRHLVVVSNKTAIRSTWKEEIKKWAPDAKAYPMPEGYVARGKMLDRFWDDEEGARFVVMLPHMLMIKQGHWCGKCKIWREDAESKKLFEFEEQNEDGTIEIVKRRAEVPIQHYGDNHVWKLADMKCDWPELFDIEWDSIIADEAHDYLLKVRDPRAANQPQWAVGMRRLAIRHGCVKLAMTGTPLRGREEKIFGILHWLDPVRFSSYWAFIETYFKVEEKEYQQPGAPRGVTASQKTVGTLRPEMEAAFFDILDSLCLRRTKREVRRDLPPILPQEHWVELEGEHKRQYDEFLAMGYAVLKSGTLEGMGRLSELTRLKQLSFGPCDVDYEETAEDEPVKYKLRALPGKSPKVQLMMDMLSERGALEPVDSQPEDAPKFIIASQYTQIIKDIREMFTAMKVETLEITGSVTGTKRDMAVTSFKSPGGPKILLLNTKAGGASLTLDAYCDEMFVLDETWVHDDQVQLMGRVDNRGERIATRIIHFIRTRDTIEERIALGNDDQNQMQSKILDSRRGDVYALRLIQRGPS